MNRGQRLIRAAVAALLLAGAAACGTSDARGGRAADVMAASHAQVADHSAEQYGADLVRRLYDQVFTHHRLDQAGQILRTDYIQHTPSVPWGLGGFTMFYRDVFFKTFPDVTATLEHVITQGNLVFTFATWKAEHTPTGKPLTLHTADVYRVQDGRLAEHWDNIDYSALIPFGFTPQSKDEPASHVPPATTPGQQTAVGVFRAWLNEFIGQRRLDSAPKYVRADFIQHEPGVGPGVKGLQDCFRQRMLVIPDLTYTIKHLVTDGKYVGIIWLWNGTSKITGKRFEVHTADIYRVQDGKLAEHWTVMDYSDLPAAGIQPPTTERS